MLERIGLTMLTASMGLNDQRAKPGLVYNEQQAINDIHDILEVYYKLARERFVDSVIIQARERYIVGEKGPLKIFSPEYVGGLSNEELAHIAGENFATSATRTDISTLRGERLQKALEIARRAGI